jgi:hypothetical protein
LDDILRELIAHENKGIELYRDARVSKNERARAALLSSPSSMMTVVFIEVNRTELGPSESITYPIAQKIRAPISGGRHFLGFTIVTQFSHQTAQTASVIPVMG